MEENNQNQEITENLKNEATSTVSQVKETIKNADFKKDSVEAKEFLKNIFKDPLGTIQDIVNKDASKYFKFAIIIFVIWTLGVLVKKCFDVAGYSGYFNLIGKTILSIIKVAIVPALSIFFMSVIIFILNKNNKKSLTTIITAVTSANIPVALASILSLLNIISHEIYKITTPINIFASTISTVLMYFAAKAIFGIEKNSDFIKKFALIETIYCVIYFVLSFFGIYI